MVAVSHIDGPCICGGGLFCGTAAADGNPACLVSANIVDLNFPKQDRHEHENTPLRPAAINVALPIIKEFFRNRLRL
jgi:hypothetical protein